MVVIVVVVVVVVAVVVVVVAVIVVVIVVWRGRVAGRDLHKIRAGLASTRTREASETCSSERQEQLREIIESSQGRQLDASTTDCHYCYYYYY